MTTIQHNLQRGADAWNKFKRGFGGPITFDGVGLNGLKLEKYDLSGCIFNECEMSKARFSGCDLKGASFVGAKIEETDFSGSDLSAADFTGARLFKVSLTQNRLVRSKFKEANIAQSKFQHAKCERALFSRSTIVDTNFSASDLLKTNFFRAQISDSSLSQANLEEASFTGVRAKNISGKGLFAFRTKLDECHFDASNLEEATLTGADLTGSSFISCDFRNGNLRSLVAPKSMFKGCSFSSSIAIYSNFRDGKFSDCNFQYANLCHVDFSGARLKNLRVFGSSIWGADLETAIQSDINISKSRDFGLYVSNLEFSHFMFQATESRKIKTFLESSSEKIVLILGRFTTERKQVLENVRTKLTARGYIPVIFDFEKPDSRDFTETLFVLSGLARFIIADLSNPASAPHELASIAPNLTTPILPIIESEMDPYALFYDLKKFSWVRAITRYPKGLEIPDEVVNAIIEEGELARALKTN